MLPIFNLIEKLFKDNLIRIGKRSQINNFRDSLFFHIDEKTNLLNNLLICAYFNQSPVVIIDQFNNEYFILSFYKTLLIINHKLIKTINPLVSTKPSIKFCFLSDCQNTFIQNINQNDEIKNDDSLIEENNNLIDQDNIINIDEDFKKEIQNFNQNIYFMKISPSNLKKIINIKSCLTGYLIKESYSKLNNKSNFEISSQEDKSSLIDTFNENDFIVLRSIGFGGTWVAKLIFHIDKEELFVMKHINTLHENEHQLFKRELDNYIDMSYPRLPKFYGTVKNQNMIVIEFINGQDLSNIEKKSFTKEDKYTIIFQLLMIFNYLHTKNFIYRDLKPNNVIIDEEKRAYLIDFDRMHHTTDEGEFTKDIESPFTLPKDDKNEISFFEDIYSLCMMIYYIINEKEPPKEHKNEISNDNKLRQNKFPIYDFMIDFYSQNCKSIDVSLLPNDPLVQFDLGNLHLTNQHGIENDYKAIGFFRAAAKNNHPEALFNLGAFYYQGKYVEKDMNESIHYFTLAAEKNHLEAQYNFGVFYSLGKYVERDINKAISYYSLAANQNHPQAQHNLALIYYSGQDVKKDINKAIHYFSLAVKQNHPNAQYNLGAIYYKDQDIKRDIDKAIHYFTLAADQNHPNAQYSLGVIYYEDQEIKRDIGKSIYYFSLAADQNHQEAQYSLGVIYYTGQDVTQDIGKAIHYFKLAAKQGCAEAQFILGNIFISNQYVKRDVSKAIQYYSQAANQNHSEALFKLGSLYYFDQDIPRDISKAILNFSLVSDQKRPQAQYLLGYIYLNSKDIEKAIHYFELAAKQGCLEAQFILGNIYISNQYVQRDVNKAIQYYSLAANQNHSEALFKLGSIYALDQDIPRDMDKAIHYFSLAADHNHPKALYNLAILYYSGQDVTKDIQKAIRYLTLAADQGFAESQFNLGAIYFNGDYVPQDIKKAMHYFSLAADQSFAEAQFILGIIYNSNKYFTRDINKAIYYFKLASNQEHSKAQYILGTMYYLGINLSQNVKEGQYYIILSSLNGNRQANFAHGFLLHEGKHIKKDIMEAIKYYKESSSFNNQYAKNNLGIIYKNGYGKEIKENKGLAIEYFKEAIRHKNDYLSKYNLAHLYFYDESYKQDINGTIKLLVESSRSFQNSMVLLCLLLIKQFGNDLTTIEQKIKEHTENKNAIKIINAIIYLNDLMNKKSFDLLYESYKKMDFLYNIGMKPILSSSIENAGVKSIPKCSKAKNISELFYEGFGLEI
ncbi:hypothetical protein M9Y10_007763 [Tritrichomonas musculus]|uniref:Protein kinase domain-containing protein n=1 Tax=Tritrichomonas musculus TaxID=1915356 RepID=A0ABR2J330_9EUKA